MLIRPKVVLIADSVKLEAQIMSGASRFNTGKQLGILVVFGKVIHSPIPIVEPDPDSNVNVSRGPQGRPKPVKAWVTRINWRILKNSIGDLLPLEVAYGYFAGN
ncbi:hypothetical protein Tco_1023865 [Tanacetum coccineum]